MGRGKSDGRAQRRKKLANPAPASGAEVDPQMQHVAERFNAEAMPSEVSAVEASIFYQLVCSQSWEEVEAKIEQVVTQGLLTEGVLLAGFNVLEKATASKEDPRTIASIGRLVKRLTELLQALQMSPALKLMDEWATMLEGGDAGGEGEVQSRMQQIFTHGITCTKEDFAKEMDAVMQRIEEQDDEFEASVTQLATQKGALSEEQQAEVEATRNGRKLASKHIVTIQKLAREVQVA